MFEFDPNTVTLDSLIRLGLSKYSAQNIIKYREKGGRFKSAKDLRKIYGLDSTLFRELYPHIRIERKYPPQKDSVRAIRNLQIYKKKVYAPKEIDINSADTTAFKTLRGIGPVYAKRIVKFRSILGGFYSIDQIGEVWGISDSLFQSIRPILKLDSEYTKRNINELDKKALARHPYISWNRARHIINYRDMHGKYISMDELKKLHGFEDIYIDTLKHYFIAR